MDINIARWNQACTAAEAANKDGSHPEDALIAREGYTRAQFEVLIWNDSEKIEGHGLRVAVEAARKAKASLEKVELEVSENRLTADDLREARNEVNVQLGNVGLALQRSENHWRQARIAAEVANRDGRHDRDVQEARDGLNRAKAETLIRTDSWPL